ncbi:MAG: type II toxin-antitoxin system VapC family toxin [Chloroflexota bacterium]
MPVAPVGLHLVDTSAWILVLRRSGRGTPLWQRVHGLMRSNAAATTGVVRLEVLRGARNQRHLLHLYGVFSGLHQLPIDEAACDDAARLGLQLRAAGVSAQSTDLLIAAVALRAGAIVVHCDRDFDHIARHVPLLVESHV